ncbi:MAG: tRNA pseudouridine(13) synthase TruD [Desulfobacteraceae bacterium]|nr:tRNA pseudouridine(13) synthase TruD [Desulfobacteraceae bacterium]
MSSENLMEKEENIAAELKRCMANLPFVASEIEPIGGVIKAQPEHFQVEEVLPYEPCGEGEHVFVTLRRSGWNTVDAARMLAEAMKVRAGDVGWGGRKDKQAVTTQTFSVHLPLNKTLQDVSRMLKTLPFEILKIARHKNKLKTGHVASNRFRILLSQTAPGALSQAQSIAAILKEKGLPNFFGPQRFGIDMRNLDRAAHCLKQKKFFRGKSSQFVLSALQSALFNIWLQRRIQDGLYNNIIKGDIVKKTDTGGIFVVDDEKEANERFSQGKITFTGPIYGHKMKTGDGPAQERETAVLDAFDLDLPSFKPLRAKGSRRPAIVFMDDLNIRETDDGLIFSFSLPSGSYATIVMREFIRSEN